MRESQLYVNFFRSNILLLVIPALILSTATHIYFLNQPNAYQSSQLLQYKDWQNSDITRVVYTVDQAVNTARNRGLWQQLNLSSEIEAVKVAPYSITVNSSSDELERTKSELTTLADFLSSEYSLNSLGEVSTIEKNTNQNIFILLSFIGGFSMGLISALLKTYLQKY